MKVFGFSEADFLRFLETYRDDIPTKITAKFMESFKEKDCSKFLDCLSDYLIVSKYPLKIASLFSPILLACFKRINDHFVLFCLLSKLCSQFKVAQTYLYRWISVSGQFCNDYLLKTSHERGLSLELMESYFILLHYDTAFFKRHLPISRIMVLFTNISQQTTEIDYSEWLIYCIVKTFLGITSQIERFNSISPQSEAEFREKVYKLIPTNSYNFVNPIISYDDVRLNQDDYFHFWEDCFGSNIVSVSGILFERCNSNVSKPFVPNPQSDFIVLPSIQELFQEFTSSVAFGIPVLLEGPIACGKSSLIAHLAKFTGRSEIPDIVTVQISDQVDTKFLLGSYVCNDLPGEFSFNLGPLLRAIESGSWIILEDIDSASPEVITLLQSIIESRSIASISGYESKVRGFNPEFRIFFTQRSFNRRSNGSVNKGGSTRTVIKLLEKMCKVLYLPEVPKEEIEILINQKWPTLSQFSKVLVEIFLSIRKVESESDNSSLKRNVCLRDLFKCCIRLNNDPESLKNEENLFLNISELFVHFSDSRDFCLKKAYEIGNFINLDKNACEYLLFNRKPNLEIGKTHLKIGRSTVNRTVEGYSNINPKFAFTDETLQLLERLLCSSVISNEPILLCGETGVGKTSCIQYLSELLHKKLTVINMNQQSDSIELFGGYKPINIKYLIEPLCEYFMEALTPSFKENNRDIFIKNFNNDILNGHWEMVVERIESIIEMLSKKKSFKKSINKWLKVQELLSTVKAHLISKSELIFGFVDGSLTKAMKNGEWILLDEINLSEGETLQSLLSLFENNKTISLFEKSNNQSFQTHPDFRLFACMNPATDVGKRSLPIGIQSRFTEFYIHEMIEDTALHVLVQTYIGNLFDSKLIDSMVKFYLNIKKDASNLLKDLNGHRPIYSLRNLCRALRIASQDPFDNASRSLYESLILAFLTNLDVDSGIYVRTMIEQRIFKNSKTHLRAISPKNGCVHVEGFPVPIGDQKCENGDDLDYIQTRTVVENKKNICRILSAGKNLPILLQGETSVGKTSMIRFLAKITGHVCLRVNNHEHTDLQDYIGAYAADESGKLVFKEGVLAKAMRQGAWLILDELNLAPTDVLEALNRVLDDNRELYIPETKQLIKAHPHFTLFATQNPPGKYGGRKMLSRAFRNRFIELNFAEFTSDQLEEILHKRCKLPQSYAKKMVSVMVRLQKYRSKSDIFAGKNGLITLRDLFRWGERYLKFSQKQDGLYEWKEFLALQGYYLLAGRSRNPDECEYIRNILSDEFKHKITDEKAFYEKNFQTITTNEQFLKGIVWTRAFKKLGVLIEQSILYGEPILLVGGTGCGKTTICQYFSALNNIELKILNCHQNTECSDFLGSYRPNRGDNPEDESLFKWEDGPLVHAVKNGNYFLIDEISLADDSVLERLNSLFEPERKLYMTESTGKQEEIIAKESFRCFATMNPGGDFGKRELSPAFRDRFTEIWCSTFVDRSDIVSIIQHNLDDELLLNNCENPLNLKNLIANLICKYLEEFYQNILFKDKHFNFSIRDILTWTNFINKTCVDLKILSIQDAFRHGAMIVCIDSLGTRSIQRSLKESKQIAQALLDDLVEKFDSLNGHLHVYNVFEHNFNDDFRIGPFNILKGSKNHEIPEFYYQESSQVYNNLLRVARAMQLDKPILLEGPPGVGKTSMIEALSKFTGHNLIRINLSEQTDISDLFGSDLPMEGENSGTKFVFCEGPLLKALKEDDTWILFDEMNLASQTVLEGLNACLDHRGEIFIPELNRKFIIKRDKTRIFASQNPCSMDGSRKGLPKSFLNRFTVVFMDQLDDEDCRFALEKLYPQLSEQNIRSMLMFNRKLLDTVQSDSTFARLGGPYEFNLRDLTRWGQVTTSGYSILGRFAPEVFVDLIYTNKMRNKNDRDKIKSFNTVISNDSIDIFNSQECTFYMNNHFLQVGYSFLSRKYISKCQDKFFIFREQLDAIQSAIKCIEQNWLTIFIGSSGSGKTHLVKMLANISGQNLITISSNNEMDTNDLLGGFEQKNIENDFRILQEDFQTFIYDNFSDITVKGLHDKDIWYYLNDIQDDQNSKTKILQNMKQIIELLTNDNNSLDKLKLFLTRIIKIENSLNHKNDKTNGSFEWKDSKLIRAVQNGYWLLIDNANLLNPSVLDRLNSLFEKDGTLVVNERGTNCEPIVRHNNFRAFLTIDPINGELSRAMKNRGIEIVVPELNYENIFELYQKFNISIDALNCFVSKDENIVCKEVFNNFESLSLKTQFGQCKFESFKCSSLSDDDKEHIIKYKLPIFIPDLIVEPSVYEIYRDNFILKNFENSIKNRLFIEHCSDDEISKIIRQKIITNHENNLLSLSYMNDLRENSYLLNRTFQEKCHEILKYLNNSSFFNIFSTIFERFNISNNTDCDLKQFSSITFEEIFKFFSNHFSSSDLSGLIFESKTDKLFSTLFYCEELLNIIQQNIHSKPFLMIYRLAPLIDLLYKSFNQIFISSENVFQHFSNDLSKMIGNHSFINDNWPIIMSNIEVYSKSNHFQTIDKESHQKLLDFEYETQLNSVMNSCSMTVVPETSTQCINGSEIFFSVLIIKRLLDDSYKNQNNEFFENIMKYFDQKHIVISPKLFALLKLHQNITSSPDLLCFLFEFIQNNLSLTNLFEYFNIEENYNSFEIGKSTTFEHFPVISMTLFNAVQWNENITVQNFLFNRSTLNFYHQFMNENYFWLKRNSCNQICHDYLSLLTGFDNSLSLQSEFSSEIGIQLFRIGQVILQKTSPFSLPFDPRERQIAIRSNWIKLCDFISNERKHRLEYYRNKFNYSGERFYSKFGQELDRIFQECIKNSDSFEPEIMSRECPEKFIQLIHDVQEFENNQLGSDTFDKMLQSCFNLENNSSEDLSKISYDFSNLQSVIIFFINQLKEKYFDFHDILTPYLLGLWILAKGTQEIIFFLKNHKNIKQNRYEELFNYQTTLSPDRIAELCSELRNNHMTIDNDSNTDKCLSLSTLMECQNSFGLGFDIHSNSYKFLLIFTEKFLKQWKIDKEIAENEELKRNALFHMKLDDNPNNEEDIAFQQEFPSCDKDFEDLMSNISIMKDDNENKEQIWKKHVSNDYHLSLVRLHLSLKDFNEYPNIERINFTESYLKRFKALPNYIKQQVGSLSDNFERLLVDGLLVASDDIQHLDSGIDSQTVFNVYKESPYCEVKKCFNLIHKLKERIIQIKEEIDEHPTLSRMLEIIDRFSKLKINSPLLTFSAGLEVLLKTLEEWQNFAHREIKMLDFVENITQIVFDWRSMEISFWNNSLDSVHDKIQEKELQEYWFKLVSQIDEICENNQNINNQEFLKLLKYFIELSNIGQFNVRLKILDSVRFFLRSLDIKDKRRNFISIIECIHSFYERFNPLIDKEIQNSRQPIEKELKELVKISSWTPKNFWSVRDNLKKTHRRLFNLKRKYEQLLQRKSYEIFSSIPDDFNKYSSIWAKKNSSFESLIMIDFEKFLSSNLNENFENLNLKYLKICNDLSKRIENGCKNYIFPIIIESDDFNQSIRDGIKEYSSLKPKEDPLKDIEKWKKSLGLIQTRKRRALGELFKELKIRGLSYQKGLIGFNDLTIDSVMLENGIDFKNNLHNGKWNCKDESIKKWTENCDILLHRSITLYMQFFAIVEKPHEEITINNLDRMKGFGKYIFTMLLRKRKTIKEEIKFYDEISSCLEVFLKQTEHSFDTEIIVETLPIDEIVSLYQRLISLLLRIKNIQNILQNNNNSQQNSVHVQMDITSNTSKNLSNISVEIIDEVLNNLCENYKQILSIKNLPFFTVYERNILQDMLHSAECEFNKIESNFNNAQIIEHDWKCLKEKINVLRNIILLTKSNIGQEDSIIFDKIIKDHLLSIEKVYKELLNLKNIKKSKSSDEKDEEITVDNKDVSFEHENIFKLFKELNSSKINKNLHIFIEHIQQGKICFKMIQMFGIFLQKYLSIHRIVLELSLSSLASNSSTCVTILKLFNELIVKGFCKPEEPQSKENEDKFDLNDMKNTGFGDGDTTGAEDVSDRLDCQDQLDDLKKQEQDDQDGDKDENEDDQDIKDEKNGLEMDDDFDGKEFGPEDKQEDDEDEDEQNDEEKEDEDEEFDDKMGNVENDDECLDENLWGDEEDNNLDDLDDNDQTHGKESLDKQTVANENDDETDKPEKDKEIDERNLDDENDENEEMNDEYKGEEANQLPNDPNDNEENKDDKMNLPDQIDLDEMNDLNSDDEELEDDKDNETDQKNEDDVIDNEDEDMEEDTLEDSQRADLEKTESDNEENIADEDVNNNINTENNENFDTKDEFENDNDLNNNNDQNAMNRQKIPNTETASQNINDDDHAQDEKNNNEDNENGNAESSIETDRTVPAKENQGPEGDENEIKEEISIQKDRSSKRTLAEEANTAKRQKILPTNDENIQNRENFKSETMRHVEDSERANDLAMDSALPEDIEQKNVEKDETQNSAQLIEEQMEIDEQKPSQEDEEKSLSHRKASKNDRAPVPKKEQQEQEICKIIGEFTETSNVKLDVGSSFHQNKFQIILDENEEQIKHEIVPMAMDLDDKDDEEKEKTIKLFQERKEIIEPLIYELCNQLQLVLEPTKCSKFKGDYKTGKRLNMRKVIAYVASDFRKDKIWLRRSKPSKRQYQILIAVDDSKSMDDNQSKMMAFDSLLMLGKAFSIIEAGSIGVLRYGQETEIVHSLNEPFTEDSVLKTFKSFTFNQTKTLYSSMLNSAISLLQNSRQNVSQGVHQLLVIVSDGRGISHSERALQSALIRLKEMNIFSVFIIIDNPQQKNSIVDLQSFSFTNGACKSVNYIEHFPFPYYVILKSVSDLPLILGDSLRQWFEMINMH